MVLCIALTSNEFPGVTLYIHTINHWYVLLDTATIPHESSLEEMQKQALYISQNVLRGLQEIGEGTYNQW